MKLPSNVIAAASSGAPRLVGNQNFLIAETMQRNPSGGVHGDIPALVQCDGALAHQTLFAFGHQQRQCGFVGCGSLPWIAVRIEDLARRRALHCGPGMGSVVIFFSPAHERGDQRGDLGWSDSETRPCVTSLRCWIIRAVVESGRVNGDPDVYVGQHLSKRS